MLKKISHFVNINILNSRLMFKIMPKLRFFKYKLDVFLFNKYHFEYNESDLITICTRAKNEDDYILEWVEYHLNLGFDNITIFDNNDSDSLSDILKYFIDNEKVNLIRLEEFNDHKPFNDYVRKFDFKWCAFIDVDEFITLNHHENIKDFLENYEDFDCICLNWMVFGTNGHEKKTSDFVQNRFKKPHIPVNFHMNEHIKSIVKKTDNIYFYGPHIPLIKSSLYCNDLGEKIYFNQFQKTDFLVAFIKHYYTKSFEEWFKKFERGYNEEKIDYAYFKKLFDSIERDDMIPLEKLIENTDFSQIIKKVENYEVIYVKKIDKSLLLNLFCLSNKKIILYIPELSYINSDFYSLLLSYSYVNGNMFEITLNDPNNRSLKDYEIIL